jgi:hypothetical protein
MQLFAPLTLPADPTTALHAATKQYVDAAPNTNVAINSGFSVNQRAYVSGTALAAGAFGHDRWKGGAGGGTYTFTQSGGPATTITITAGTLQQVVEGAALLSGSYTLSWTGTAQGRTGAGSYAASPVAVTATSGTNLTIEFNTGTLGLVKLEAGTVRSAWLAETPAIALERCMRFYQYFPVNVGGYSNAALTVSPAASSTNLAVVMRAAPSVTLTGQTYNNSSALTIAVDAQRYYPIITVSSANLWSASANCALTADL